MPASMVRLVAIVMLSFSLVSGCSGLGERAIPWYVTRKVARYLDLDSAQKKDARVLVDDTLHLLRTREIPQWINLLREVRAGVHGGMDDALIARLQAKYDARLDAGVTLLAPRLAELLAPRDADQLDHFAARMREDVEEQYDELDEPEAERIREIEKRTLKFLRKEVGTLGSDQEETVRKLVRALPNERVKQHQSALANIAHFRAFLTARPTPAQITDELQAMWAHRYDALGPGRGKPERRREQRTWLLAVYQTLSTAQRAHLEARLSERIEMLKRFVLEPER